MHYKLHPYSGVPKWHKIDPMTTRAGAAGLLTGLIASILIYPLFIARPEAFLQGRTAGPVWVATALVTLLMIAGGFWAGRWSRSSQPGRSAILGALAGGLAGAILFCLWGAAAAGCARWAIPLERASVSQVEALSAIVRQTLGMFLFLFLGGSLLGAFGGWLSSLRRPRSGGYLRQERTADGDECRRSRPCRLRSSRLRWPPGCFHDCQC